ncbi:hypothetical protein FocnCong_v013041 [Fusarium oxysporum f. sp. conglutinans]|nr:hypothetical protein FocnCong_v012995 [Fusarium oxysporum f. sp. conglutinans]KAG7001124.1 hypothetical protein FocnCong_v013041 [Fusarium oxysporum f. sp. conglutinans]KAH7465106.1 hypothetical protein FOMA001_g16995 [Fusarium oxysporum f. sp. matthiolae]
MSAKPGQPGQQQQLEDRLFRHFRGWNWSERARDTSSWLWDFGYDIQRHGLRKWACKDCILVNRPIIATFTSSGLQNAANHLWREHKTPAPEGEKKSTAQLKSEGALKSSQPTIASVLKLDVNKPTEQNIANSFISRFDKQHFQRLLVELIVSSNQSFSFAENPILREIFDYLSPSVSIQHANLSARAVRYKIIQEYNRHKQTVIEVLSRVQIHTTKSTYGSTLWIHIHSIPFHVGFSISISTPRSPFHMFHMWKSWNILGGVRKYLDFLVKSRIS